MAATAEKTDPALWDKVKKHVTKEDKGGKPGQWSARKAQLATSEYKHEGGGYKGRKSEDNHLTQWTKEEWGTKSGKKSGETGERYLPKTARKSLSKSEYDRTTAKKRADSRKGRQFSSQPSDVAKKTAPHRATGKADGSKANGSKANGSKTDGAKPRGLEALPRTELMRRAAAKKISGRSRMRKADLVAALRGKAA
jgi:hypothetical protein